MLFARKHFSWNISQLISFMFFLVAAMKGKGFFQNNAFTFEFRYTKALFCCVAYVKHILGFYMLEYLVREVLNNVNSYCFSIYYSLISINYAFSYAMNGNEMLP